MQGEKVTFLGLTGKRVDPGVMPDIAPVAAKLAKLDIIAVAAAPGLKHKDKFVLAAIERAHPGIVLDPDANIFEPGLGLTAGCEQFADVAPIHANVEQSA